MELYRFKLTPADRKASLNFLEINNKYNLFTTAAANCSQGVTFRHDGKKITVDEIAENYLIITLSSVMPLASPTRTLSAFSRELLRLDKETALLGSSIYNHTLFNNEPLKITPSEEMSIGDISDTMLLKSIIDLLYSPPEGIDQELVRGSKDKLKEAMLPFINYKPL